MIVVSQNSVSFRANVVAKRHKKSFTPSMPCSDRNVPSPMSLAGLKSAFPQLCLQRLDGKLPRRYRLLDRHTSSRSANFPGLEGILHSPKARICKMIAGRRATDHEYPFKTLRRETTIWDINQPAPAAIALTPANRRKPLRVPSSQFSFVPRSYHMDAAVLILWQL